MSRLPVVGSDDGTWGGILNDYLSQSIDSGGALKTAAVSAAGAEMTTNKDTDGTLFADSDDKYPSQKATKTYADTKLAKSSNLSDLANTATARTNLGLGSSATLAVDTDDTLSADSDSKVPSQKAIKAYADNNFVDLVNDQNVGGIKNFNGAQMYVTSTEVGNDSVVGFAAGYGGILALMIDGLSSEANIGLIGYDSSIRFGAGGVDPTDTKIYRTGENELSFDGAALRSVADPVSAQDVATKAYADTKVPNSRTVNGKALSANITLDASDIGLGNVTNDAQLKASNLDTDGTLAADSDTKIASQKAVKAYADNNFVDLVNNQDIGGIKNFNGGQMYVTSFYEGEDSTVAFAAGYGGILTLMVDGLSSEANIGLVGYDSSIRFGPGGVDPADTKICRTGVNELSFDGAKLVDTRPIPRVYSTTSSSSLTPDISAYDQYCFTALTTGLAIDQPTGTPQDGEKLLFRIKDNGTARALTWDVIYNEVGVALPITTTVSKTVYIGAIYNSATSKWDVLLVNTEA